MNMRSGNTWKAVLLLSVVVPVGLIVSFKFSGLTGGPATIAETTVLQPLSLELERPCQMVTINQTLRGSYCDSGWINQSLYLGDGALSFVDLGAQVDLETDLNQGFIEAVQVEFRSARLASYVYLGDLYNGGNWSWALWKNLSLSSYDEGFWYGAGNVEKAYVKLLGVDNPRSVLFAVAPMWRFKTPVNETTDFSIQVDVTYFNGSVYKKVVQPFNVTLKADDDNSFDAAKEVVGNQTLLDCVGVGDKKDFFKVNLLKGQTLKVVGPPYGWVAADLLLYRPGDMANAVTDTLTKANDDKSIEYCADRDGYWYVEVRWLASSAYFEIAFTVHTGVH